MVVFYHRLPLLPFFSRRWLNSLCVRILLTDDGRLHDGTVVVLVMDLDCKFLTGL